MNNEINPNQPPPNSSAAANAATTPTAPATTTASAATLPVAALVNTQAVMATAAPAVSPAPAALSPALTQAIQAAPAASSSAAPRSSAAPLPAMTLGAFEWPRRTVTTQALPLSRRVSLLPPLPSQSGAVASTSTGASASASASAFANPPSLPLPARGVNATAVRALTVLFNQLLNSAQLGSTENRQRVQMGYAFSSELNALIAQAEREGNRTMLNILEPLRTRYEHYYADYRNFVDEPITAVAIPAQLANYTPANIQRGMTCKTATISKMNDYICHQQQRWPIPYMKHLQDPHGPQSQHSVRSLAKRCGSLQGELLERSQAMQLCKVLRMEPEEVGFDSISAMRQQMITRLEKNQPIMLCYASDIYLHDSLMPYVDPLATRALTELSEHAVLITAYDPATDSFRCDTGQDDQPPVQWLPAASLYFANQQLNEIKSPERYVKRPNRHIAAEVNGAANIDSIKWRYVFGPSSQDSALQDLPVHQTATPRTAGFKSVFIACRPREQAGAASASGPSNDSSPT